MARGRSALVLWARLRASWARGMDLLTCAPRVCLMRAIMQVHVYVQGWLRLGSLESFILLSVSDEGLKGATSGRYGSGVHVSVGISAGYLQSNFLGQTTYHISGRVSQVGLLKSLPEAVLRKLVDYGLLLAHACKC